MWNLICGIYSTYFDLTYFDMGWLRLVGCLKIQVSLQNIGLFCTALLQKRPIFLSILLIVATPYVRYSTYFDMWNVYVYMWNIYIYIYTDRQTMTKSHRLSVYVYMTLLICGISMTLSHVVRNSLTRLFNT